MLLVSSVVSQNQSSRCTWYGTRKDLSHRLRRLLKTLQSMRKACQKTLYLSMNSKRRNVRTHAECGKPCPNKQALRRHLREVHTKKREGGVTACKYLTGIYMDFCKGMFMVRREFSGVSRPIHCQHSTYAAPSTDGISACELNE